MKSIEQRKKDRDGFLFLASGLDLGHQQEVRFALLEKAKQINEEIKELEPQSSLSTDESKGDESIVLKMFAEYWNHTFDKDPVSHIYDSAIENFIGLHPTKRKWLLDKITNDEKIKTK